MKATNETSIFTAAITDTATHYLPDTGAGEAPYDVRGQERAIAKVVNDLDQSVTVELEGTTFDDDGFAEGDVDVASVTVAAGAVETLETSTPWAYLRVSAAAGTAPSSGQLKVVFESDQAGAV